MTIQNTQRPTHGPIQQGSEEVNHRSMQAMQPAIVPPPPPPSNTAAPAPAPRPPPPPPSQSSTQGASGSTNNGPTGYAAVKTDIEARLADNEDYQRLGTQISKTESLMGDFSALVALKIPGRPGESALSMDNIRAVANDPFRTPSERAAAQRLIDNPEILAKFMKGDDKASLSDCLSIVEGLRAERKAIKDQVTAEVKAERNVPTPGVGTTTSPITGGTTPNPGETTPPGATTPPAPGADIPKPPPSTLPGIDGALENLGNSADHLVKQMEAIANDPNMEAGLKAAKMAQLQAKQQSVMNMLSQLSQMMSNTAKLWSDIAMNSVRNIK